MANKIGHKSAIAMNEVGECGPNDLDWSLFSGGDNPANSLRM